MPPRLLESSTAVAVYFISLLPTANADTTPVIYLRPKVEAPAVSDAEALQSLDFCHISSAATTPASVAVPADSTKVQESSIDISQMPPELLLLYFNLLSFLEYVTDLQRCYSSSIRYMYLFIHLSPASSVATALASVALSSVVANKTEAY
jgi:hypothetical protein